MFSRTKRLRGNSKRAFALPALRMCHDSNLCEQRRQALSLLRLLQRSEARLGSLSFSVCPSRWDGGDRHGADLEGEPGFRATKENSSGGIQAKKNALGGSG